MIAVAGHATYEFHTSAVSMLVDYPLALIRNASPVRFSKGIAY